MHNPLSDMNAAIQDAPSLVSMFGGLMPRRYNMRNGWIVYSGPQSQDMSEVRLTIMPQTRLASLVKTLEAVVGRPVWISTELPSARPSHFNLFTETNGRYEWIQVIVSPDRVHATAQYLNLPKLAANLDAVWNTLEQQGVRHALSA